MFYELSNAYGRNPKTVAEVKKLWEDDKDFIGDYQLGFRYVNKSGIPKPCTVQLRYRSNQSFVIVKVHAETPPSTGV